MSKQTTISFSIRKKSSRLEARSSKYSNEKENETCYSPIKHSSKACETSVVGTEYPLISVKLEVEDSDAESSPLKALSPSKRKLNNIGADMSPTKVKCPADSVTEWTPSSKFTSLCLNSPECKPAPPVENSSEKIIKKELFPEENSGDDFRKARLALHTSSTDSLPGREAELAELKEFLTSHIKEGTSGSIYISGPPGTGKTACLTHLMSHKEIKGHFQTVYVNCTSMKSPGALYSQMTKQLRLKITGRQTEKSFLNAIDKHLSSKHKLLLLVIDELDQLESRNQSVLYTVFEWPIKHPRSLVLVGIANALDLTDRTLPRLRARGDLAPRLLPFAPYSREQIISILRLRLEEAGVGSVFSAPALQMLASKVATMSGDVRRALDLGRRVIEMTGNPYHEIPQPVPVETVLKPTENHIVAPSSPSKLEVAPKSPAKTASPTRRRSPTKSSSPRKTWTSPRKLLLSPNKVKPCAPVGKVESPRKTSPRKLFQSPARRTVDLKGVMTAVGEVYGSSQSGGHGAEEMPLQQRLAVCTLILILKNAKGKDVTVAKLHEVYRRVCNKRRFEPLDQTSFLSMLSLVEARGLLSIIGKGKPSRLSKVCLKWVQDEVVAALKDRDLLASILQDVACLS